jgi:hypothetical protein
MLAGIDSQALETVHMQDSSTSNVQLRRQIASEMRTAMTAMEKLKKLNELLAAVESKRKGDAQLASTFVSESSDGSASSSSSQATDTPAEAERKRIEADLDDDEVETNTGWRWGVNPIYFVIIFVVITPCLGVAVIKGCWAMIDLIAPF